MGFGLGWAGLGRDGSGWSEPISRRHGGTFQDPRRKQDHHAGTELKNDERKSRSLSFALVAFVRQIVGAKLTYLYFMFKIKKERFLKVEESCIL